MFPNNSRVTIHPLISIIVPVYNGEACIKRSLDSLLNQTYSNLDIVVVNDGSTDHTLDILKELVIYDERLRIFTKENGGVSSARNFGLQQIRGGI